MSFLRKVWANNPGGGTPITAAELNRMEAGIEAAIEKTEALVSFVRTFRPNTAYPAGTYILNPEGFVVQALATFTTGTTFNPADWGSPVIDGGGA